MAVRIPSYRLHKPSGRAVVTINGRDHYLGLYGSSESRQLYGTLISRHAAGLPLSPPVSSPENHGLTINELVLAFMRHAHSYYRKNGVVTSEYDCLKSASRPIVQLYGDTPAATFGPMALKAVRTKMISLKWSRTYINKSVGRIRRIFRYGVSNELVEPTVLQKLEAVEPLMAGRTEAIELPRRFAVPQEEIDQVREAVNQRTRDLIDLALLTGARPGELVSLTGNMIDRTEDIWTATLADHKMIHKGKSRVLAFGPKSQLILQRYLKADGRLRLFLVSRHTFSNTIKAACDRLGLKRWTAHWLRHNALSSIRKESGLDGAQAVAGHSTADVTQIYAHLDMSKLVEIARQRG